MTTVGINFGLLLTQYGVKRTGPLNPKAFAKQSQNAKWCKGRKAERARKLLANVIEGIDFAQDVILYDRVGQSVSECGDGAAKKPHWRRGHYRRQCVGKGRTMSKLVFIKPMFIGADSFEGDLADTSYSIQAR